jgi:hypothetical protein
MRLAGMNAALLPLASSDMDPVHDIVGLRARSARCATASQLTRDQHISLRLPQTTTAHRPDPSNQPALKPTPLARTVDWGSHTVPHRGQNDAVLASPRGSLLDGPSSINTMALLQTHPPGHNDRVSHRTGQTAGDVPFTRTHPERPLLAAEPVDGIMTASHRIIFLRRRFDSTCVRFASWSATNANPTKGD